MYKNLKKKHFVFLIVLVPLLIFGLSGCSEDEKASVISIWEGDTDPIPITGNYPADDATADTRIICAGDDAEVLRWNSVVDPIDEGGDDDADLIYYDVYFGTTEDPPLLTRVASNEGTQTVAVDWEDLSGALDPGGLTGDNYKLPNGTTYYWRVVAIDMGGNITESDEWSFTTSSNNRPEEPYLLGTDYPQNGAIGVNMDDEFQWSVPEDWDEDQLTCDIYISTTPVFAAAANATPLYPVAFAGGEYTFQFSPAQADIQNPNTTYYWKVVVSDWDDGSAAAVSSVTSEVWTFETNDIDNDTLNIVADFMAHDGSGDLSTSTANMDENTNNLTFASAPVIDINQGYPFPSLYLATADSVSLAGTTNPFSAFSLTFDVFIGDANDEVRVQVNDSTSAQAFVDFFIAGDDNAYDGDRGAIMITNGTTDLEDGYDCTTAASCVGTLTPTNNSVSPADVTTDSIDISGTDYATAGAIVAALNAAIVNCPVTASVVNTKSIQLLATVADGADYTFTLSAGTLATALGFGTTADPGITVDDSFDLKIFASQYDPDKEAYEGAADNTELTFTGLAYGWNTVTVSSTNLGAYTYDIVVGAETQTITCGEAAVLEPSKYWAEKTGANIFTIGSVSGVAWIDNLDFSVSNWSR